jgi:hypothetical protein
VQGLISATCRATRRPKPSTRAALAATGAFLLLAMQGPSTASATHLTDTGSPGGPTVPWGFNEFWGFSPDGTWNAEQADREIALANAIMPRALSAHRLFVQWRRVEGTRDQYNWTVTDRAYQAMQGAEPERKPVMVIHDAPNWARDPAAPCPAAGGCTYPPLPQYDGEWRQFVQDAAARYPNVRAIEVWNEPNLAQFWGPAPDPGRYVEVLAAAHDAAAAAGSSAPVITAGLSPVRSTTGTRISSREFLREIYNQGCACDFEGIGTHAYPRTEPLVDEMWREINRLFAVRDNHNDPGTPLWNTEVSVSSDPTEGVGAERQGTELVRLYRSIEGHESEDHEIESFIIYRFHDAADGTPYWNHTGVLDQGSLDPKPAYCELGAAIGDACPDTPDPPDTEAPQTIINSGPQGKTTNASPSFTFSSSEPDSTFECRLDSGSWGACTSPKSYQNVAAGTHVFEVRATDQAGNTDTTPAARSFKVIGGGKGGGG